MNNEKVLFLDFDGVLNDHEGAYQGKIDFDLVRRVSRLCTQEGLAICLSTNWRRSETLESLGLLLRQEGLNPAIPLLGVTPDLRTSYLKPGEDEFTIPLRGLEIEAWLKDNPDCKTWIALDDIPGYFLPGQAGHLVVTNPGLGVTDANLLEARTKLQNQLAATHKRSIIP